MAKNNNIKTLKWPSQSPEFNIIENLWVYMQDELWKINDKLKNRDDIWRETQKIWYTKVDNLLPKLYKSFPKRLPEVLITNGKRINQ